jgi:hypothetical protein
VQGPTGGPVTGIKLYKYVNGAWQHISDNANPGCYDATEGKAKRRDWYLEINVADIDTRADESLDYLADLSQQRVTFQLPDATLWSLRFPTVELLKAFVKELKVRCLDTWQQL